MGVGWIDNIYNNSSSKWYLKSKSDRHNGAIQGSGSSFLLDDAQFHAIESGQAYKPEWCGIPWYYQGKHYKVISKDQKRGVLFYTSEIGPDNWIMYEELGTGRVIAKQKAPKGADFHCNLRFENNGFYIDIVKNNEFSGENALFLIYQDRQWMHSTAPVVGEIIGAIAVA